MPGAAARMAATRPRGGSLALRVTRGIELPFGGMKKSGHGRGKGFAALHGVPALRTIIVKHG